MLHLNKIKFSWIIIFGVLRELLRDLFQYYVTPYPFLLALGAFKRLNRRLRNIWISRRRGRSSTPDELVDLILEMKRCNPMWGAKRISDELQLLGISIHRKTIQRILKENGFCPPKPRFSPPPWKAFLHDHKDLWAMDFTGVLDFLGRQVFILVIVETARRNVILINSTLHPTRDWIIQQIRNCSANGYDLPKGMILDNDSIYGHWIDHRFNELFGIEVHRIPRASPWHNGICERFHKSLKQELLRRILLRDVAQIQKVCRQYQDYFNDIRPHQGIGGKIPNESENVILLGEDKQPIKVKKVEHLHGLFTEFQRAA